MCGKWTCSLACLLFLLAGSAGFLGCEDAVEELLPSLEIEAPGNGDHWEAGLDSSGVIRWQYSEFAGSVHIDLYRNDVYVQTIADSVNISDTILIWTPPFNLEAGQGYQVFLEAYTNAEVSDLSDAFHMDAPRNPPAIEVTSPRGGTKWEVGLEDDALIEWEYQLVEGLIRIDLCRSDTVVTMIADSVALEDSSYTWTVPQATDPGSQYQVCITSLTDSTVFDFSTNFQIQEYDSTQSLEIVSPSGGDRWMVGLVNGATVEWENHHVDGTVTLELHNGNDFVALIGDEIEASALMFSWTVPEEVEPGNGYRIYIESNDNPDINHTGHNFQIEPYDDTPMLEVTSPGQGDSWQVGVEDGAPIEWAYANVTGTIKVELYLHNDFVQTILDTIPVDSGGYSWTVPGDIEPGHGYRVYVESHDNPDVNNLGSNFEIEPYGSTSSIEVTEPGSGTRWPQVEPDAAVIEWVYENLNGTVNIDLYFDGEFVLNIADEVAVDELTYAWTVPLSVSPDRGYQVYIESNEDEYVSDMGREFRIDPPADEMSLDVTEPGGGTRWMIGEENGAIIEWESENLEGTLRLDLYDRDGFVAEIASEVDVTSGTYFWTVPGTVPPDNGYTVYAESNLYDYVNDESNSFRIDPPEDPATLEIASPGQGDTWIIGEENGAVIEWTSENLTGTLKFDLYRANSFVVTITDCVAVEAGSFTWTVPNSVDDANNYHIYAESNELAYVNCESRNFRIDPNPNPMEIEVTTPGPGDRWTVNEQDGALIEWEYSGFEGTVTIDLYQDDVFVMNIATAVQVADLSYTWTVPTAAGSGQHFAVYVASDTEPDVHDFSREFRIDPADEDWEIEVTAPGQGDSWLVGEEGAITWTYANVTGTISIDLYLHNGYVRDIVDGVNVANGSYTWTMPLEVEPSNGYRIYIICDDNAEVDDLGSNFTVVGDDEPGELEVTGPGQGDEWVVGEDGQITWTALNVDGTIHLELYLHNSYQMDIADGIDANAGAYTWIMPEEVEPGNGYRIYIESDDDADVNDLGDNFTVVGGNEPGELEVTGPGQGDEWVVGEDGQITWTALNVDGTIHLELYLHNSYEMDIASGVNADAGSYTWIMPEEVEPGNGYRIYIESDDDADVNDLGDNFTVVGGYEPGELEVTGPGQGDEWVVGEDGQITWTALNVDGTIHLELYLHNSYEMDIASGVNADAGSYTWIMPEEVEPGNGYRIYIESDDDADVNDLGDNFTVVAGGGGGPTSIEVTSPSNNDHWSIGGTYTIEWESEDPVGTVRIDLYHINTFEMSITDDIDMVNGQYQWTIPENAPTGNGYRIYIESNVDPDVNDQSSNFWIDEE